MFDKLILGNEKALVGGASGGLLSLLSLVGVSGQLTVKELVYAAVTWVVTHAFVYITTNTQNKGTLLTKADSLFADVMNALDKLREIDATVPEVPDHVPQSTSADPAVPPVSTGAGVTTDPNVGQTV